MVIGVLFIVCCLHGCTDFILDGGYSQDTVIPVSVIISATVKNATGEPMSGVELQFDLSKTNGQDFRAYRTTDENGYASVNQYGYNLHKGQVITVRCTVIAHLMIDEKTAGYDRFLPDMQTHATTAWYDHFYFTLDR